MQRHTLLLPQSLLRLRGGMYALWGTATPSSTCEAAAAVLQSCRRVHPAASLQWQWPGASTRPLASEAVAAADVDDKDADVNLELGMAEVAGIAGKTSRRARRRAAAARRAAVAQTTLAALATHPASRLGLPAALVEDDRHPIRDEHLSSAAWLVLSRLRGAGHEAYVVGGTVRDILLGGTPKDYDLLTSAEPHQVRKLFGRCVVVGRSFPVCHVHTNDTVIEVSSFTTNTDATTIPADASSYLLGRHKHGSGGGGCGKGKRGRGNDEDVTWAAARRENASRRDFTVNALLYDPFSRMLYDYVGAAADCRMRLLRTIAPPAASFEADPARLLRAVRLAARAGLQIEADTAEAMTALATRVAALPHGRLQMELAAQLGYGAAASSVRQLWRFGMLDLLLPHHALYLKAQRMSRMLPVNPGRGRRRHDLLFDLLAAMDTHVMPQAPVDPSAWVALLAAPLVARQWQALVRRRQSAASKASRWASEEGGSDGSSNSTEELQESDAEAAILHGGMSRQLWDVEEEDTESTSYGSKQQQAEDDNGPLGPGSSSSGRDSESEDAGGDSTSSDSDSEGPRSDEEAGSRAAARAAALEAYAEVIEATMELLLQPLDASMCARLELDPAQLLALRPPSRGQVAVQAQIEQLAAVGDDAVAVVALEDTLCTGSDGDAAVSTAAAIDSLPPHAAIISSILPRAAVDKAAALLLAEAELRGRELPWELPPNGASSSRQQLHHRGHRRARKPTVEEKLVLSILRDPRLGYGQLTSLAALQAAVKDGK